MFEAVIFDWDGTLADSRMVVLKSFQAALSELHVEVSDEFVERRIGIGAEKTFKEILQKTGTEYDESLIKRLLERKVQSEIELAGEVRLFGGAEELLKSLKGKAKLALASMNNREVIDCLLDAKNLRKYFKIVLTADDVHRSKPDPEIFLASAAALGTKPERCLVVEDSIFGVKAAKAARMGCIAVLTGVYSMEELGKAKPDLVVRSLMEKDKIMKLILS
jgi:beta-phosphoglucomutase